MYVVFEGGEGSGKSSASKAAVEKLRQLYPDRSVWWVREPGGCEWSEKVRELLFDPSSDDLIGVEEEILLFAAARVQLLRQINKAREDKVIVVSDRNVWSSLAYQVSMAPQYAELIKQLNCALVPNIRPDLVFWFDVPPELGLERAQIRLVDNNRNDTRPLEWHRGVYRRYQDLVADRTLANHVQRIDASQSFDQVMVEVVEHLQYWLR